MTTVEKIQALLRGATHEEAIIAASMSLQMALLRGAGKQPDLQAALDAVLRRMPTAPE